mgnify:CR=1 FL=1
MTNPELNDILQLVYNKKNVFITGPGGTGKTTMIREIYKSLVDNGVKVYNVAPTGAAAVNMIGGTTIHSFMGVGINLDKSPPDKVERFIKGKIKNRFRNTNVLIIDEISMVGAKFLDKLNKVAQLIRYNTEPFGGVTIIASGDFLQLSPVKDDYCFKSQTWKDLNFIPMVFNTPHRFVDKEHFEVLQRVRMGEHTLEDVEYLGDRNMKRHPDLMKDIGEIKPTSLSSLRRDVNDINMNELAKLPGKAKPYTSKDVVLLRTGEKNDLGDDVCVSIHDLVHSNIKAILKADGVPIDVENYKTQMDNIYASHIVFKEGAQVMLTANLNIEDGLIHGSRGVVKELRENSVVVLFKNGQCVEIEYLGRDFDVDSPNSANGQGLKVRRAQIPLILAWSVTIHKSQGATLDCVELDLGPGLFAPGQAYVALSRCRSKDGIYIKNLKPSRFIVDKSAVTFTKNLEIC